MEMLKSQKSELTCSYCLKIYKDPIELQCGDSMCRDHLKERDVVKQKRIKCKKCNGEFKVKNNEFKSNESLTQLIENQSNLNAEEFSLKHDLEMSMRKFFELYDEYVRNRNKIDSDVFDHFQELRFQIDDQREELKKRIDDIALAMINQEKKSEESLLKTLKENDLETQTFESLEHELNEIEQTFRDPSLLIEAIQAIQSRQEESLKDNQLKLNQMYKVKDDLKATNEFQSNLFSFNQEATSLFGLIKLDGYWLNLNSFKGQILTGKCFPHTRKLVFQIKKLQKKCYAKTHKIF